MKKIIYMCLFFTFLSCYQKNAKIDLNEKVQDVKSINSELTLTEEKVPEEPLISWEEKLYGVVFNSVINADHVNIYINPSLDSEVLYIVNKDTRVKVLGTSKEIDSIDGYTGNWLQVSIQDREKLAWVFSKFIENGRIESTKLDIIGILKNAKTEGEELIGVYYINDIETIIRFSPHKEEAQNFYTFAFDYQNKKFHYSNIPGSYAWYPDTNELKHISYIGTDMESAWVIFTDDFKYLVEDFGTAPPPSGLVVWRIEDSKEIFSGYYYRNVNLKGNTINVVFNIDDWDYFTNRSSQDILEYGKKYKEANPPNDDILKEAKEGGMDIQLIIICELDLDTGIKKIIDHKYILK